MNLIIITTVTPALVATHCVDTVSASQAGVGAAVVLVTHAVAEELSARTREALSVSLRTRLCVVEKNS